MISFENVVKRIISQSEGEDGEESDEINDWSS
jgi:hypothetical protein